MSYICETAEEMFRKPDRFTIDTQYYAWALLFCRSNVHVYAVKPLWRAVYCKQARDNTVKLKGTEQVMFTVFVALVIFTSGVHTRNTSHCQRVYSTIHRTQTVDIVQFAMVNISKWDQSVVFFVTSTMFLFAAIFLFLHRLVDIYL